MARNPNRDDLSKIKNWLSKRGIEEPIPSKSQNRVLTDMARSIRQIKPLPSGVCHICSSFVDRLIPIQMKCCLNCCKGFIRRTGGVKVIRKGMGRNYCDKCLTMSMASMTINPDVCVNCITKIGKTHKHGLVDMKEQQKKDTKKLPYKRYGD